MMQQYYISGMTCNGCKASVTKYLLDHPAVTDVAVDLTAGIADIAARQPISVTEVQALLPEKYHVSVKTVAPKAVSNSSSDDKPQSKLAQLKPLLLILSYIAITSVLLHRDNWDTRGIMLDFMGLFYIVFSFFKLLDLKGFPASFRMYDPLAKRVPFYANIYPFVETALGLLFLLRFQVVGALVLTIIILGITTVGVMQTLLSKQSIRCACLGTALKLPMTEATFIENAIMLVMAVSLLLT